MHPLSCFNLYCSSRNKRKIPKSDEASDSLYTIDGVQVDSGLNEKYSTTPLMFVWLHELEFGVLNPVYHMMVPSKMCMLSVVLDLPRLDVEVDGEFCDLREHVRLPGCLAVPRKGSATPTMGGSRWWPRRPGCPPSIGCGDPVCCACGDLGDFFSTAYSEENGDWDLDSDLQKVTQ